MTGMSSREGVPVPLLKGKGLLEANRMNPKPGNLHCASPTQGLPPKVLDKRLNTTTTLPSIQEQATLFNQQELNQKSS